jgi:hypothetical protein
MTHWAEPRDLNEWWRRSLSVRPVLLALVICGFIFLELRFDWVERAVGAYLMTTNADRPESGAIWEKERQTLSAQKTLEKIVTDRQASQREALNATSFAQIAAGISPDQGVMLSVEQFRKLYLNLPPAVAREFISPLDLLRIKSEGYWRRTYFERRGKDLVVYFLDFDNRVLHQLDLPASVLTPWNREDIAITGTLEELPNFANRIYTAERFFDALWSLPDAVRRNVLPHPEVLLKLPGQIVRVGISDETAAGFIELGFEISSGSQREIVVVQGYEWSVWRLRSRLEGQESPAQVRRSFQENAGQQ